MRPSEIPLGALAAFVAFTGCSRQHKACPIQILTQWEGSIHSEWYFLNMNSSNKQIHNFAFNRTDSGPPIAVWSGLFSMTSVCICCYWGCLLLLLLRPCHYGCCLAEGCLDINNITMLGLISVERSIDSRSLSGWCCSNIMLGEGEEAKKNGEGGGSAGKTVSNLLIYKGYFLNSKSLSIKPHVFPSIEICIAANSEHMDVFMALLCSCSAECVVLSL